MENTSKQTTKLELYNDTEHEVVTTKYYELRCADCDAYIKDDGAEESTSKEAHDFGSGNTCDCGYKKAEEDCQHTTTKRVENTAMRKTRLNSYDDAQHEVITTKYYDLRCADCDAYISAGRPELSTVKRAHSFNSKGVCACGYEKVEESKDAPYVTGFEMSAAEITVGDTVNFTLSIANASDGDTLTIEMLADDKFTVTFENVTVRNGKVSCVHEFSNDGNRSIKFRVAGTEYCAEKKLTVKAGESKIERAYVVSYEKEDAVEKVDGETFTVIVVCNSDTVCVEMYFGKVHDQTTYAYSTNYTEANGSRTFKMTYTLGKNGKSYAGEYPITVQPLSKVDAANWKNNVYGKSETLTLKVTHGSEKDGRCSVCGSVLGIESGKDGDNRPKVTYNKQTTLVEKGKIRYVEQYWGGGNDGNYHQEYWRGVDQSEGKCTRAAASMALSYMGIDLLPKEMTDSVTVGYVTNAQAKDSSCEVRGAQAGGVGQVTTNSSGAECSFTYDDFLEMYNDYASDTEGKYSPIVIHTVYWYANINSGTKGDLTHAFLVIGRDENDPDYFYVVDSGHGYYSGKVKFTQEGPMRVSEYKVESGGSWVDYKNNDGSIRYSKDKILMGVWQYYKD